MSATTSTVTLYGKFRYLLAGHTPTPSSGIFKLPDESEFGDERTLPLHDVRPLPTVDQLLTAGEGTAQLSTHGFTAVKHPSVMHSAPYTYASWRDPALLQKIYVPETEEMVKRITGASRTMIESLVLRDNTTSRQDALPTNSSRDPNDASQEAPAATEKKAQEPSPIPQQGTASSLPSLPLINGFSPTTGGLPPAPIVHNDYAPAGARKHIRLFHPTVTAAFASVIAAEDRLLAAGLPLDIHYSNSQFAPRWAIYSVWRPLKPVKRDPLACGDVRSFTEDDLVMVDVTAPTLGSGGTALWCAD